MPAVDEQSEKLLLGTVAQPLEEVAVHVGGSVDASAGLEPPGGQPPTDLASRYEGRALRRTQTVDTLQARELLGGDGGEPADLPEKAAGDLGRALAGPTGAQQERQQLPVREGARTQAPEPLARAVFDLVGALLDAQVVVPPGPGTAKDIGYEAPAQWACAAFARSSTTSKLLRSSSGAIKLRYVSARYCESSRSYTKVRSSARKPLAWAA